MGEPSTPPLLPLPLLLPPLPPPSLLSLLSAMATPAPSTLTPIWWLTPTELSFPLTSLLLLLPVLTTLLPEVALLAVSMLELLLDLTATVPATAWWLTPTVPLSPSMSPLFRLPVLTTLLPRE